MAEKKLSATEVLALMDSDEEELNEVMAEGSDDEFFEFEELENLHGDNIQDDGKYQKVMFIFTLLLIFALQVRKLILVILFQL